MASGGGSHPSHLPIATLAPPHGSNSTSLQTPDTSSLFMSSFGSKTSGSGGSTNGSGAMSGFPGSSDVATMAGREPHSFTSLEELLDVTGINSMGLGNSSDVSMAEEPATQEGGGGVGSLQKLAREVEMESSQQDNNDGVSEPPSKRQRMESSNNFLANTGSLPYSGPSLDSPAHSSTGIRVQTLRSSSPATTKYLSPLPSPSPPQSLQLLSPSQGAATSMSPAAQSPHHSSSGPSTPIVSLLDKRHLPPAGELDGHSQVTGNVTANPSKVLAHPTNNPPSYSSASSVRQPIQAFPQATVSSEYHHQRDTSSSIFPTSSSIHSSSSSSYQFPNTRSVGQSTSWSVAQPPASQPAVQALPAALPPAGLGQKFISVPPASHQSPVSTAAFQGENQHLSSQLKNNIASNLVNFKPKPAGVPTSTPSQVAESINSNSKAVVIQLIQLYKQYQETNDQQGMTRVREQINFLVSAQQKILAAKNNILKTTSSSAVNGPTTQLMASGNGTSRQSSGGDLSSTGGGAQSRPAIMEHSKNDQQQLQASKILEQLSALKKAQPQLPMTSLPAPLSSSQQLSAPLGGISARLQASFGSSLSTQAIQMGTGGPAGTGSSGLVPMLTEKAKAVGSGVGGRGSTGQSSSSSGGVFGLPSTSVSPSTSLPLQNQASSQAGQNRGLKNSQEEAQRTLKHLQLLMTTLPESKRPKNLQELKLFIQQYSSLVNKGGSGMTTPGNSHITTSTVPAPSLPSYSASLERSHSQLSHPGQPATLPQTSLKKTFGSPSFSPLPAGVPNNVSMASSQGVSGLPALSGGLSNSSEGLLSHSGSPSVGNLTSHLMVGTSKLHHPNGPSRVGLTATGVGSAHPTHSLKSSSPAPSVPGNQAVSSLPTGTKSGGIQPGVVTPLPNGVTLETLGVLCRLPDSDLVKLNLPQPLLSAIKVWKARQSSGKTKVSNSGNKSNIPVLIPPPAYSLPPTSGALGNPLSAPGASLSRQIPLPVTSGGISRSGLVSANKTGGHTLNHSLSLPPPIPKSLLNSQPNVLPSGAGFPPRSLHAFIPRPTPGSTSQASTTSQHMTRFKVKMEQHKAETERLQALQKALQSSEEARIAYRFSAHLEKMHGQLLTPDTVSSFKSYHDILARLLPYHIYAEPEPPAAAVEQADAVYESVAQVLLSRSRGLKSRYDKIVFKTESEGGVEQSNMRFQLEQLFVKGEQERIQKENQEKKEAEQIAADLSTMAETADSFDADFSFGDVFSPLMSLNSGIT